MTAVPFDGVSRVMKDVPAPYAHTLEGLWDSEGKPKLELLRDHFFHEGRLTVEDATELTRRANALFREEGNLLEIAAPVTVCGDVHGQFYDLLKLLQVGGDPAETQYLFLGDYVDRGNFSVETLLFMYAHKICYPKSWFMLRGNHECRHLTEYFTFKDECKHKYDMDFYDACCVSFDGLPLAAVMNGQFLCVHGGISPDIVTLDDIRRIERFREPPQYGPLCDLLWADPMEDYSADADDEFDFNGTRGCSFVYGYGAVTEFLENNGLLCLLRAHEAQDEGYRMYANGETTHFPTVITLFSAPNYLDAYGNKGAVLRYEETTMNIRQFNHSPHPYYLSNFMDVITWSLPFVAEKVSQLLVSFLDVCDDSEDEEDVPSESTADASADDEAAAERARVKARIMGASRMMGMMRTLRSERETIMQLKQLAPGNQIPAGMLAQGADAIHAALGSFQSAHQIDLANLKMPNASDKAEAEAEEKIEELRRSPRKRHTTPAVDPSEVARAAPTIAVKAEEPKKMEE